MKKMWRLICDKIYYVDLMFYLLMGVYCIWLVEDTKWKIFLLFLCVTGISGSMRTFFSKKKREKCERVAEIINKALRVIIILGGSIIVLIGILG